MSWLWKSDTNSPASFEKALSKLSGQISAANIALDSTRSRGRRAKALWTLYTTLAYLVSLLILVLVVGPQYWGLAHYAGLIGSPLFIYSVRLLISTLVQWKAARQQAHLNHIQKQREEKIAALKKATKYDSTQELLQKYGGGPTRDSQSTIETPSKKKVQASQQPQARTGIPPPPTANIKGQSTPQSPLTPQRQQAISPLSRGGGSPNSTFRPDEPEFAPNAFTSRPAMATEQTGHWYDRILDVLLGEDEASAKYRLVLLCQNCRLVNGQAPPGIKTLEDLGKWRCASCGAWNGRDSESTKIVQEMQQKPRFREAESGEDNTEMQAYHDVKSFRHTKDNTGNGTGLEHEDADEVTRRVTRSAGKEPVEGL